MQKQIQIVSVLVITCTSRVDRHDREKKGDLEATCIQAWETSILFEERVAGESTKT